MSHTSLTSPAVRRTRPADRAPALRQEAADADGTTGPRDARSTRYLDRHEARALTDAINATSEALHVLIARAKAGKAWLALGYSSFAEYVDHEFHISRSRAYQFLDQHKVVSAIAAAIPDGMEAPVVSEAAARDLKWFLDDLLTAIRERTANADPRHASDIARDTLAEYRDKRRDLDGVPFDEVRSEQLRVTMSLFSALQTLTALPTPRDVINAVPLERRDQIAGNLRSAIAWLLDLEQAWIEEAR